MNVCTHVEELPQSSVAVYVYERARTHPVPLSEESAEAEMLTLAVQLSVALADPAAGNDDGLHPSEDEAGHDANTGASVSTV